VAEKQENAGAPNSPPPDPEGKGGSPPPFSEEPDALLQLRMQAADFLVNNLRFIGYLVGAGLLVALAWGLYDWWSTTRAEAEFYEAGVVDFKMPPPAQYSEYGIVPADDPSDLQRIANVTKGAELYEAAAREAHGAAAVYAWLQAASTWERLGKPDKRLEALKAAYELGAGDLPGYAAASAYAAALQDAQRGDVALGVLRDEAGKHSDFYGEELLLSLTQAQIAAGRPTEAQASIDEFKRKFPDSPRVSRLNEFLALGAPAGPAAGSPPAPAPTPAAPADPPAPGGG
jgi:tetratricopeptide (TPR) repeat protein